MNWPAVIISPGFYCWASEGLFILKQRYGFSGILIYTHVQLAYLYHMILKLTTKSLVVTIKSVYNLYV